MNAWRAWVALWSRQESPRVLAILRVTMALVLLYDFVHIADLGVISALWGVPEVGGLGDVMGRNPVPEVYRLLPADATTPMLLWGVMVGALVAMLVGFLTPAAITVALLTSAQLAQILPNGDRGIDLAIRDMLMILALSDCGRIWSIDARLFGRKDLAPAWPRHLIVLQLLVIYFMAGVQKVAVAWWPWGHYAALYMVLQDPAIAAWKFGWLEDVYPLTQLATAATMVFELLAAPMVLVWWFRATRTRPGRLRALFNRLDIHKPWMIVGVLLHVGIAATMTIGIFPYAMLGLYPAFFHPDELPRLLRAPAAPTR